MAKKTGPMPSPKRRPNTRPSETRLTLAQLDQVSSGLNFTKITYGP